jgi:hypothetical protein
VSPSWLRPKNIFPSIASFIGTVTPGILRLGYAGGGPYLYMLIIHGGGANSPIPNDALNCSDILPGL